MKSIKQRIIKLWTRLVVDCSSCGLHAKDKTWNGMAFSYRRILVKCALVLGIAGGGALAGESATVVPRQPGGENATVVSLAGPWEIRMDQSSAGIGKKWYAEAFTGDPATLPGTVDTNPRQPPAVRQDLGSAWTNMVDFSAVYPYIGGVWYQRVVEIPQGWEHKQISLFLERCQWETFVWIDDTYIGTCNSLVAPHVHTLPKGLTPGPHRLTILVDNANRKGQAEVKSQDVMKHMNLSQDDIEGAKLNCGGHHMLWGYKWNGILGKMELRAAEPQHLMSLDVYPEIATGTVKIKSRMANLNGAKAATRIEVSCRPLQEPVVSRTVKKDFTWSLSGDPEQTFGETLALKAPVDLWDEFTPNLYLLTAELRDPQGALLDRKEVRFGMRELGRSGLAFTVNGRPTFMRATLEDFIFPLTGYPPVDVESWRKIISIAKSYGLNMFRFHSCTPPDAAFQAADELGFYFQVEVPGTSCPYDESPEVENYLFEELKRMVYTYGNHPSMLFVSMGNEQLVQPSFVAEHQKTLMRKVEWGKKEDSRHFYTCTTQPYTTGRNDDYYVSAWGPRKEPMSGIIWGEGWAHDSRFNAAEPNTTFDYREAIKGIDRPVMSHEVAQWMVYPDLREISRYHGAVRAFNFEHVRDLLGKEGRLEFANDYVRASGMLSLELHREEIESALRTPNLGGFQLLDLHDYPGQGTSTVGILNSLWESKGLITPEQFRSFCGPTVVLARLPKRVWTNTESFSAKIELSNYGPAALPDLTTLWRLEDSRGHVHANGKLQHSAPQGGLTTVGDIAANLQSVGQATRMRLIVETVGVTTNGWDFWVYPAEQAIAVPAGVTVTNCLDQSALNVLKSGGTLLFCPPAEALKDAVPGTFTTVFWNSLMKSKQVSKTMGILCDPAHPALASFPTEFHSNWQWWDVVMRSSAVSLTKLPKALRPIVQVVDSPQLNRQLAMIFEARVGSGRLLFCATDIVNDLENRPVARQLRASLLNYIASPQFFPDVQISAADIATIIDNRPIKLLGGKVTADSEMIDNEAGKSIDGNPETLWHTPWGAGETGFPHSIVVEFPKAPVLKGCSIFPRQDIYANGLIKGYEVYASADGKTWGEAVVKGEFTPDRELKRVAFPRPIAAKFLKLVALSGFNDLPFTSIAELDVEPSN